MHRVTNNEVEICVSLESKIVRRALSTNHWNKIVCSLFLMLIGAIAVGCTRQDSLPPEVRDRLIHPELSFSDSEDSSEESGETMDLGPDVNVAELTEQEWISPDQLPWTYAEVHYLRGRRIGYSLMTVAKSELADFNLLKIERIDVIDRAPSGESMPVRQVKYESFEKPNGELSSFKFLSSKDGETDLEIEGQVVFDQLDLTRREGAGRAKRQKIPWPGGSWGPLGIQFILMRSPMQPGEIQESTIYLPQMGQFVPVRLEAKSHEITALPGQSAAELLAIDVLMGTAESGSYSRVWTDHQGIIQKTASLTGESVIKTKVDEGTVRRLADQIEFRRYLEHQLPVSGDVASLLVDKAVTIEVESIELDPFSQFLSDHRQQVRSVSAGKSQVLLGESGVLQQSPQQKDAPGDSDLDASLMIPADNPLFIELADQFLESRHSDDIAEAAEQLSAGLHRSWQKEPLGAQIRSTMVAARSQSGSSIECASVLVAMLRNREIPARLVGGLLIDADSAQGSFHVWAQTWTGQGWLDLDAYHGGPVGNQYLTMVTTAATGENPYHLWLPKLKAIREISSLNVLSQP